MQVRGTTPVLFDNIDKTILAVFGAKVKELEYPFTKYVATKTSTKKFERVSSLTMFGDVPEKGEGADYALDLIKPGWTVDFTHLEYGLGFRATQTALEDDQHDQLIKAASWLAFSARYTEAKKGADILNNAFTTTFADGKALCAVDHVLKGGGTGYNRLTVDSDLSVTSLQQAINDAQLGSKLDSGQIGLPITSWLLVVHPSNLFLADRICNSAGLPGSADNDRNPLKALFNITPVADPLLTDTDAWFLVPADKARHGLVMYNRVPISAEPVREDDAGNKLYRVRFRKSFGFEDWRNVVGTPGA